MLWYYGMVLFISSTNTHSVYEQIAATPRISYIIITSIIKCPMYFKCMDKTAT